MLLDFLVPDTVLSFGRDRLPRTLAADRLWDDPRGLSGTEVNLLGVANELTRLGHTVRLFTRFTSAGAPTIPCQWHQLSDGARHPVADVAIAFHDSLPLREWPAGLKVAWHQTITPPNYELMAEEDVDLYISATALNAATLQRYTGAKRWAIVPNGWDIGPYAEAAPVPGRLFYHTSAERGLLYLLRAMPQIRRACPEAHLVVWARTDTIEGHHPVLWAEIDALLPRLKGAVSWHTAGGSRREVLASLATASVVAYPSQPNAPCEVMPVSLMEACATGVPVVTSPSDHFDRAFHGALSCTPAPVVDHLKAFAEGVITLVQEPHLRQAFVTCGRTFAEGHRFQHTVRRLLAAFAAAQTRKGEAYAYTER